MANQDLFFDITKTGIEQERQQYIINRVGDGGLKTVTVHVRSNGRPYNLTSLTPIFEGVKPDGTRIIDAHGVVVLDANNGVFRYTFPLQASAVEGEYEQAFFKLRRGDQTDSTIELNVTVLKNRVEIGINSESYISDYTALVNQLNDEYAKALEKMKTTADSTKLRIDGNQELAETLRSRLTNLQNSIDDGELVTQGQLTSEVASISDMIKKLVSGIKDATSTANQAVEHTSEAVNKIENTTVSSVVSSTPIDDIDDIHETGYYFYNTTTRNLPTLNGGNANGYIHAVMRDADNGMIEILGTGYTRERYNGSLFGRWTTNKPVTLWTGSARKGSTIELRGSVSGFGYLIIDVAFYTNKYASLKVRVEGAGQSFYLDAVGAKTNGNVANATLEEVTMAIKDATHIYVQDTQWASSGGALTASDKIEIKAVYGVY